jgi:hypothetical protein
LVRKEVWHEAITFHCMRCDHMWTVLYEVRRYTGSSGQEWQTYCREGLPVRVPYLDAVCGACGGLRVKVLPKQIGRVDGVVVPVATSESTPEHSEAV